MKNVLEIGLSFSDYLIILLLIICIVTDIKSRRIYNKILIPFLIIALGWNFFTDGWQSLADSVKGLLIGLAALIIPFARGGIGAGDVKLLAVIGGIKGSAFVISTFLAGAIAGGVLSLVVLVKHRRLTNTFSRFLTVISDLFFRYGVKNIPDSNEEKDLKPLHLPYSLAIGAGVVASYSTGLQHFVR